ncbi:hypothetical protein, partial [Pseudomonas sp.]|uniref:hypothetical protein n=1 Tax=Pseudomonas sp. TaxID=306 RepID=UPI003FD83607
RLAIENGHACNQRYFRLGLIAIEAAPVLALTATELASSGTSKAKKSWRATIQTSPPMCPSR